MRKATHIVLLTIFACSTIVLAAEFKLYPGAKIDQRATDDMQGGDVLLNMLEKRTGERFKTTVYSTNDSFEKVYAFYKGIGKEEKAKYSPGVGRVVTKTKSGLIFKESHFSFDRAANIGGSEVSVTIQRPYLGEQKDEPPDDAKYLDEIYDYISNVTAIIVEERVKTR